VKAGSLERFEAIARAIPRQEVKHEPEPPSLHPFDTRNIHPDFPAKIRKLFDDGHFAEATLTAFKYIDKKVQDHSGMRESGYKLMMDAFDEGKPKLKLTPLITTSEIDEQKGYRFVFAGSMWAIRNPRAHEFNVIDDPDTCLEHLSFVSMLLRRLELSGYR
jgi:uncharacterized protein (TIGR02391 family)